MLEAKSYRRQRGEAPLDVEAEVRRLLDSPAPAGSGADLTRSCAPRCASCSIARNERRCPGEAPLDVEAETERQLADLVGSG